MAIRLKQAGIDDFVDLGARRRGRRHLVGEHLSGLPVRHPVAPLLVLVRSQPGLDPHLSAAARDPQRYLRDCAERYGVRDHIRFDCEVTSAEWDEGEGVWRVETAQGPFTVELLIAAPGFLSEPATPALPGLEDFEGETFHTARWNHDHDLTGRRVAVIGTGASAIQAVPQIQPIVEHLDLFQRTPPWVMPHRDRPITDIERRVYRRFPALQRAVRDSRLLEPRDARAGLRLPAAAACSSRSASRGATSRSTSPIPTLRARLTPDYSFGCKRVLPSNEWYPAITQPNVERDHRGHREVRPNGIVSRDGELHEVDTIVFATGFHVTDARFAKIVRGRDGALMSDVWNGSPQAYRGTAVAGFPNLFIITGPEHRPRPQLARVHDRGAARLPDGRAARDGAARRDARRGAPRGAGGLQRRPAEPHGPHGLELGRLLELVPRRERQEHDDLARLHLALPPADAALRRDAYELTAPASAPRTAAAPRRPEPRRPGPVPRRARAGRDRPARSPGASRSPAAGRASSRAARGWAR